MNMQQKVQGMLQMASKNNPMFGRVQEIMKGNPKNTYEDIARRMCQQRGIDFDGAVKQFEQLMNQ